MKILYISSLKRENGTSTNSYFEYLALKKIFKNIDIINPEKYFFLSFITRRIFYHLNPKILEPVLNYFFLSDINKSYDLIYVNSTSASYISKKLILKLKKRCKKIITLISDNPFTTRDKKRWKLYLESSKYYDVTATYYESRITMGKKIGVKNIILLNPPYQIGVHCKKKVSRKERKKLSNDISIIATWFPERGKFFKKLIDYGLNIKIYGNRWEKDPNYELMKKNITIGHITHPLYSKIIQLAKISICLPSVGNCDGITRRSIEIPAIGTLLFAKRSKEHKKYFIENKEAIFFDSAKDCYKKCLIYLKNKKLRNRIAKNGQIKVTKILKADYYSSIKTFIKRVDQLN